jgi:hypothetical protein
VAQDTRDRYPDALRAGALLVVVFGHWIATLPRLEDGRMVSTEHLLMVWDGAGTLTWVLQVVPLFVLVSAAVSADGVARRLDEQASQRTWWAGRALGLARPTVTYLAVLAVLALIATQTGGRLLGPLDQSLTVHLWFLVMLLAVQALLPFSVMADDRFGLRAVGGLLAVAILVDLLRGGPTSIAELRELGTLVTGTGGGIGWLNMLVVWLLPQQLGIAWRRGRFGGLRTGIALLVGGLAWLAAAVASGYPVAVVGVRARRLLERPASDAGAGRRDVGPDGRGARVRGPRPAGAGAASGGPGRDDPRRARHAPVPVAQARRAPRRMVRRAARAPIDAGVPGEPGFWSGRLVWIVLCLVAVTPVMGAVIAFETRRRPKVPQTTVRPAIYAAGSRCSPASSSRWPSAPTRARTSPWRWSAPRRGCCAPDVASAGRPSRRWGPTTAIPRPPTAPHRTARRRGQGWGQRALTPGSGRDRPTARPPPGTRRDAAAAGSRTRAADR